MNSLGEKELRNINGGISTWGAIGIGALIAFIAGVLDGLSRPLSCR